MTANARAPLPPAGVGGLPLWVYLSALVAVSFVSRLPQLLSPNLLLDADECVFGLIAKHVVAGREFPIFFWGQNYGLVPVEAVVVGIAFLLFHTGALPLKLAMLAFWTAGVLFSFLAFSRPLGRGPSFWITAAFVLNPTWAIASMKAWSGYTTAFVATAALFYLLVESRDRQTSARWVMAGFMTYLIYLGQPIWMPGVVPIVLFFLLSSRRIAFVIEGRLPGR